jgi:hypothetical protein
MKKEKMKIIIGLITLLISFAQLQLYAEDFSLNGYAEAGKRYTSEDYTEEDFDRDYHYLNYHLKFFHKVSNKLNYDLRSFLYNKKYNTANELDNISRIFKSKFSNRISKLFYFDLSLKYREKRFKVDNIKDFNQLTLAPQLTFKRYNHYSFTLLTGFDNYNYLSKDNRDQLKIFSNLRAKRYLLTKKLILDAAYKVETMNKAKINRKKIKHNLAGGFSYSFSNDWFYKISHKTKWGYSDTKDDDQRDIDYDYHYLNHHTKTEHRFKRNLKMDLNYHYFKKNYLNIDLDHHGFIIDNNWDYEIINAGNKRIWFDLNLSYKVVNYSERMKYTYQKESFLGKINIQKKELWKISFALQSHFYQYDHSIYDKNRYYPHLYGEKFFFADAMKLSLDIRYRYMDYKEKNNSADLSVKFGFQYEF